MANYATTPTLLQLHPKSTTTIKLLVMVYYFNRSKPFPTYPNIENKTLSDDLNTETQVNELNVEQ